MAQSAKRGRPKKKTEHRVKHPHCETCGSCFKTATVHRCMVGFDSEVLEVMRLDSNPGDTAYLRAMPEGFQAW